MRSYGERSSCECSTPTGSEYRRCDYCQRQREVDGKTKRQGVQALSKDSRVRRTSKQARKRKASSTKKDR